MRLRRRPALGSLGRRRGNHQVPALPWQRLAVRITAPKRVNTGTAATDNCECNIVASPADIAAGGKQPSDGRVKPSYAAATNPPAAGQHPTIVTQNL